MGLSAFSVISSLGLKLKKTSRDQPIYRVLRLEAWEEEPNYHVRQFL